jgi:hypothetical protein
MYIATVVNDGICRWSHIIEITDATHVKIATRTWKAGSGDLVFYDYKYVFNFSGMTSSGNKRFYNIKADLQGNCSFINMPSNGNNWIVSDLQILGVKNRFLTNWNTAGGGSIVKFCEARPYDSDPATRTAIGIITTDNDNKFLNNRIINFLHAQVMHGNGYTISGCHNWRCFSYSFLCICPYGSCGLCDLYRELHRQRRHRVHDREFRLDPDLYQAGHDYRKYLHLL